MISLKQKKKNWLLYLGIASLSLAIFFLVVKGADFIKGSRNFSDLPLGYLLVLVMLLAPIYEEFVFRGLYTSKRWFRLVSFILLPVFVLLSDTGILAPILLVLFGISYFASLKFEIKYITDISLLLNIIVFTAVHYKMDEFVDPSLFFFAFFQFAGGAILLWLILNYGILKAILLHIIWNSTLMIFMLYNLQYPDIDINKYENSEIIIEWRRVPKFDDNISTIREVNEDSLSARNVEARFLFKYLSNQVDKENLSNLRILQTESYMKNDFNISSKSTGSPVEEPVMNFLIEKELIYLFEK